MRKLWQFLKDYYYIPLFVLAVILGAVLFRKRGTPMAQTRAELEAIEAGRRAREMEARLGTERAKAKLLDEYHEQVEALDAKQAAKAKELEANPQALAKFLVRAGSRP